MALTPAADGWERNKEQTRQCLVRAAVTLFADRGFTATTVDDIAASAGCSRRTFFRYFATKEDVLLLDARTMLAEFQVFTAQPTPGLTRWQQIRLGLRSLLRRLAEPNSDVAELIIVSWLREPAIARQFGGIVAELEQTVARALAAEAGVDPDRDLRAQLIGRCAGAACTAALHTHVHTRQPMDSLFDSVFDMLEERAPVDLTRPIRPA